MRSVRAGLYRPNFAANNFKAAVRASLIGLTALIILESEDELSITRNIRCDDHHRIVEKSPICEPRLTPAATQHRKATLGAWPPSELQQATGHNSSGGYDA